MQNNNKKRSFYDSDTIAESYKELLFKVTNLHKLVREKIDWQEIIDKPKPIKPSIGNHYRDIENSFEAEQDDLLKYQWKNQEYLEKLENWKLKKDIAQRILANDSTAYREALRVFGKLHNVTGLKKYESKFTNKFSIKLTMLDRELFRSEEDFKAYQDSLFQRVRNEVLAVLPLKEVEII